MNTAVIREYNPGDKSDVIHLMRLNTPRYFSPEEEDGLSRYLDNEIEHYFVVEYNHKVIGSGGINFDDSSTGVISWDIFHPDYQGRGFGSQLLNFRLNKLKELEHIRKIIVRTSQLTHIFYEKQGFKLIETAKDYWAEGLDMYKMEYVK